jgi:hypothetical protein
VKNEPEIGRKPKKREFMFFILILRKNEPKINIFLLNLILFLKVDNFSSNWQFLLKFDDFFQKFDKFISRGWWSHLKGFSIANCRKNTNRRANFYLILIYSNKNLASKTIESDGWLVIKNVLTKLIESFFQNVSHP